MKETFYGWAKWHFEGIENWKLYEEGSKRITFEFDDMLQHLKVTYSHTYQNVLKRCHNMMDGVPYLGQQPLILAPLNLKVLHLSLMHI